MEIRKVAIVVCSLGVLAVVGCQGVGETLRNMGFESRSARLYRKQKADNARLAAQNAEYEAQRVSMATELDSLRAKRADLDKLAASAAPLPPKPANNDEKFARLRRSLGSEGEIYVTDKGEKAVRVRGDVFFRSGRVDVRREAGGILMKIANTIKEFDNDVTVFVDGHTDSDPLRYTKAKYGDNYGLGAARANAVVKALVALGVPRARLIPRSFGKNKPIADNSTAVGKRKNRRVEFMFAFANPGRAANTSFDR